MSETDRPEKCQFCTDLSRHWTPKNHPQKPRGIVEVKRGLGGYMDYHVCRACANHYQYEFTPYSEKSGVNHNV